MSNQEPSKNAPTKVKDKPSMPEPGKNPDVEGTSLPPDPPPDIKSTGDSKGG